MQMSTLGMQMANQERSDATPPRTLEFRQAMKDFRTMFPTLDSELIECVLRSNAGHVDSTIDQLLQLSKDPYMRNSSSRRGWQMSNGRRFGMDDDSTESDDSIPSEFLDPPTSSDDDIPIRDPPPMYTPRADDPSGNFFGASHPVEIPVNDKKKSSHKGSKDNTNAKLPRKTYRAWNPPMLGTLPEDFLRILPQQFLAPATREKSRTYKSSSTQKKRSAVSSVQRGSEASVGTRHLSNGPVLTAQHERSTPPPGLTGPVIDNNLSSNLNNDEENLTPPPRPPRRIPQYNERDRNLGYRSDHIEPGNLFIRPVAENRSLHHHHHSFDGSQHSQRSRHHHHRSSRSGHSSRCHNLQSSHHHQSLSSTTSNGNHTRRSSDFSSRRMVPAMTSRLSEPSMPIAHNGPVAAVNGIHSPLNERSHRPQRSSSNSFNHHHHHQNLSGHQSPVFHRSDTSGFGSHSRSCRSAGSSSSRSRPRTSREEEQYVEDCRLAILLQNEEFIRELKRNDDFLKALEKDRPAAALPNEKPPETPSPDKDVVPMPDPDAKYTHGLQTSTALKTNAVEELEKDDKAFKENLKHMGKSARKKFNEIAKKFSVRRKSSYKSMKNIDPVFANCDDNFDEAPGPRSPTFDL